MSYLQVESGQIVDAVHMNTAINQGILSFAAEAERDAALPLPAMGMHCFINNTAVSTGGLTQRYNGLAWEVIAGDTGWRNLGPSLMNGWTCSYWFYTRRVASTVQVVCQGLRNASAAPSQDVAPHVDGFRTIVDVTAAAGNSMDGSLTGCTINANSILYAASWIWLGGPGAYTANMELAAAITYFTDDPWPAVLPGFPIGDQPQSSGFSIGNR